MSYNSTHNSSEVGKIPKNFTVINYLEQSFLQDLTKIPYSFKAQAISKNKSYNFIIIKLVNLLALQEIYSQIDEDDIKNIMMNVSSYYTSPTIIQLAFDTFLIQTIDLDIDYFSQQLKNYFYNSLKTRPLEYSYLAIRAGYARVDNLAHCISAVKQAYIALYEACHRRIPCAHYNHINNETYIRNTIEDITLFKELEDIIYTKKVDLLFHPIVDSNYHQIFSYEALSRARCYTQGKSSLKFHIAAAERLGYTSNFDWLILGLAVKALLLDKEIIINLNVSPISLGDSTWISKALSLLNDQEITERLIIEVTETSFHHDFNELTISLNKLKNIGCRIAIDDFGTGYASLGLLRKIPVDFIKIDGSYITNLKSNLPFIGCIIAISQTIKAKTIAEFVEDPDTAQQLANLGVNYLQGNYFYQVKTSTKYRDKTA